MSSVHIGSRLFVVVGPAGVGKSTIAKGLLEKFASSLELSVSYTTRAPRSGEREGKDYYFVSREDFQKGIEEGKFFEWEETHGNLYGTPREQINRALNSEGSVLFDIDIRGARTLKGQFPDETVVVLLLPPAALDLVNRVTQRSAIEPCELRTRLETSVRELSDFDACIHDGVVEYVLENRELSTTLHDVCDIYRVEASRVRSKEREVACSRLHSIRGELLQLLSQENEK
ncbi:MAG: guanylate kinase [Bdellovibrionales bacterium]|nr:guanylate kinase [Bdellovibrionales bacterium]